jgi:hypothetical protein
MKVYILIAEHESVPGVIVRAFSMNEFRKEALAQLRSEFKGELRNVEEFDVQLEENYKP